MSAKTMLRTEPKLSSNSVLIIFGERQVPLRLRCMVHIYNDICRIKIPIKCV
jgi:hypothetical protein